MIVYSRRKRRKPKSTRKAPSTQFSKREAKRINENEKRYDSLQKFKKKRPLDITASTPSTAPKSHGEKVFTPPPMLSKACKEFDCENCRALNCTCECHEDES